MAKFSYSLLPAVSVSECAELSYVCERNGFQTVWVADEIWYRDPWAVMAVCAGRTRRIRIGPGATHVFLRNPAFIAQSIASLDEISGGRAICAMAMGNEVMLKQCKISVTNRLEALKEAVEVVRRLLKGEVLYFEGEHFKYAGISLKVRPVQETIPIYLTGKAGPKSFELAGEVGDGVLLSDVYTPSWARHVLAGIRRGFQKTDVRQKAGTFDVASWLLIGIHPNGDLARELVRPLACFYLPMQFPHQLENLGVPQDIHRLVSDLLKENRFEEALELITDDIVEKVSIVGTPSEVIERFAELEKEGIKHFVVAPADNPTLVSLGLEKHTVNGALKLVESLNLLKDQVMPSLSE